MNNQKGLNWNQRMDEIRDLLKSIDQKLSHILEQNRIERTVYFKGDEFAYFDGDDDD